MAFEPLAIMSGGPPTRKQFTVPNPGDTYLESELNNLAFHLYFSPGTFVCTQSMGCVYLIKLPSTSMQPIVSAKIDGEKIILSPMGEMMYSENLSRFERAVKICGYTMNYDNAWTKPLFSRSVIKNPPTIISHPTKEV